MTSDLELLKLAAMAVGLPLCEEWDCAADGEGILVGYGNGDLRLWNPLGNDGEAFRLLADIPSLWSLTLKFGPAVEVDIAWGMGAGIQRRQPVHIAGRESTHEERAEAMRCAIVRAAAEIGKKKIDPL